MTPSRLAGLLGALGLVSLAFAIATPRLRELAIIVGLFFIFLAGGVLNWDRRGGH